MITLKEKPFRIMLILSAKEATIHRWLSDSAPTAARIIFPVLFLLPCLTPVRFSRPGTSDEKDPWRS